MPSSSTVHTRLGKKLLKMKKRYDILFYIWKRMVNSPDKEFNINEIKPLIKEWKDNHVYIDITHGIQK